MNERLTRRIRVYGVVQGVGFRPTVSRHARAADVRGTVCNKGSYVEIYAQGKETQLADFLRRIREEPPKRAAILKIDVEEIEEKETENGSFETFSIVESEREAGEIFVSPDIAICPECKAELYDRKNRRYLHPFINCTCCGPRLTILDAMPYDRERTSMAAFPMCETCAAEYENPASRRYDAQPVCCNDCGPEVYLIGRPERGADAIRLARRFLAEGKIVAVKGIGGFHLCCDAKNEAAVALLRERKRRSEKPFAVMMRDLAAVRRECLTAPEQEAVLDGCQKPIVLLPRREGSTLAAGVAPDNPKVGVMLPYAPIQLLLFDYDDAQPVSDCLVMTSGNHSGAPICKEDTDAVEQLAPLCDLILSHDRKIRIRADDTVMDFFEGKPYMVRRSRGYAPLPFFVPSPPGISLSGNVLALGGELKNSFCIGKGGLFYPSPYIGDMADVRTVEAQGASVRRMTELLESRPDRIACDRHPGYHTTRLAEESGLPLVYVQHHYAHILSCLAENAWKGAEPVIGVAFDGTGYGTDGTIWGGEFLTADYRGFRRRGSVQPFRQAGGDAAAREGWRVAVCLLRGLYGEEKAVTLSARLGLCKEAEARLLVRMAARGVNTVTSTSAGRLFDAASAILGVRRISGFEGEAAVTLQYRAERAAACPKDAAAQARRIRETALLPGPAGTFALPTGELFGSLVDGVLRGDAPEALAFSFHRRLAEMTVAGCLRIREETGWNTVALSGGVFQNLLFLRLCVDLLRQEGFLVLTHRFMPPNDGGICLGQAVAAAAAEVGQKHTS